MTVVRGLVTCRLFWPILYSTIHKQGDGDSEIALVVEDDDHVNSTMDGRPYPVARFATSLRRQLFREHLGLIPPQQCDERTETVTSSMRCAPVPNDNQIGYPYDDLVADPLSDATLRLWNDTARKNREIFTEVFRPVPSNLVRTWSAYDVWGSMPSEAIFAS